MSTFPSSGCKGARQATGARPLQNRQRRDLGHQSVPETPRHVAEAPGDRVYASLCRRQATPPRCLAAGFSLRGQTFLQALGPNLSRVIFTVAHPGLRRALIFGEMSERKEGKGKGKGKKKDRGSRGKPAPGEGDPSPGECQLLRSSQAGTSPSPVGPRAALLAPDPVPKLPCRRRLHLVPERCAHPETAGCPSRALRVRGAPMLPGSAPGPRVGRGAQPRSAALIAGSLPAARALRPKGFARAPSAL